MSSKFIMSIFIGKIEKYIMVNFLRIVNDSLYDLLKLCFYTIYFEKFTVFILSGQKRQNLYAKKKEKKLLEN